MVGSGFGYDIWLSPTNTKGYGLWDIGRRNIMVDSSTMVICHNLTQSTPHCEPPCDGGQNAKIDGRPWEMSSIAAARRGVTVGSRRGKNTLLDGAIELFEQLDAVSSVGGAVGEYLTARAGFRRRGAGL